MSKLKVKQAMLGVMYLVAFVALCYLVFISLASTGIADKQKHVNAQTDVKTYSHNAQDVINITNRYRTQAGVGTLTEDAALDHSAQIKLDDMVTYGYFGHINPTTKVRGDDIAYQYKPSCYYVDENIQGTSNRFTDENIVAAFSDSPAHRKAMLDAHYSLVGVAVNDRLVVVHFCGF